MTTKISLSVDPRVTRRILDCGQLWATGNGFCPVFIFIYLWKVPCSLSMSQENMQQLLLLSYTFVHVFVNILIRVIKQNQTNCFFFLKDDRGQQSFCYPTDIPFFTYQEDNCVIRLQKSAMVISPVHETPEENIQNPKVQ